MFRDFLVRAATCALMPVSAAGQTTPAPPARPSAPLTIDAAVREALDHNLTLLAERFNITVAEAGVLTASLRPNPVVTANLMVPQQSLIDAGITPAEQVIRTDVVFERGGKRERRMDTAQLAKSVAELQVLNTTRALILDVASAFTDVQLAELNLALARENLTALDDIVRVNTVRVRTGDLARVELSRSNLEALQFQNEVLQRQTRLRVARNHLSTVLLLPAFAVFLLMSRRRGPGDPLAPRMVMMAVGIAAAGALQYAWNFRGLWDLPEPPASLADALSKFWFDVTKSDWRASLVNTISEAGLESRPAMYWFDIKQQFGLAGVALAVIGIGYVIFRSPKSGVLLVLMFAANLAFAWTYNVGDAYIFFLPSHYIVALCAGAGIAAIAGAISSATNRPIAARLCAAALLVYPAWRGYDTFPAADRSWDRRAEQVLDEFTSADGAVFGVDSNWQLQNAFQYFMNERKPYVPWFVTEELTWLENNGRGFRRFVESNRAIARNVIVSPMTLRNLRARGYEPGDAEVRRLNSDGSSGLLSRMNTAPGTLFVFGILRPDRDFPFDDAELSRAWRSLTDGSQPMPDSLPYAVVVGRIGQKPLLVKTGREPFRVRLRVDGFDVDIRMESWLPTDTIRRAGFGHVIVDRQHLLTLERGLSVVAFPGGQAAYGSGLFAPIPRLVVSSPARLNGGLN